MNRPSPLPPRRGGLASAAILSLLALLAGVAPIPVRAATPLPIDSVQRNAPVDFQREILPILRVNCLACHNQTKAKGELILETPVSITKGGSSGPGLVPGKGAESLVLKSAAHQLDDLVMPPAGNKANARDLSAAELGLLRLWIDQGAHGEITATDAIAWSAMPTNWVPILGVALSPDGQFAFAGRANRIHVYRVPTGRLIGRLEDPALPDGAAHLDVVNALAASPDGVRLASAGYREAKIWRRLPLQALLVAATHPGATVSAPAPTPTDRRPLEARPDGTLQVGAWKNLPAVAISPGQPVLASAVSADGTLVAVAFPGGGVRLWRLNGDKAEPGPEVAPDRATTDAVIRADSALALGRADLEFQRGALQRAEEEVKKSTNALAKASEKHAANEKELTGKRDGLKAQKDLETAATRERDELAAALQKARDTLQAATNAAAAARSASRDAVRQATAARLAAEQAARARTDLERIAADLAGKADEASRKQAADLAQRTAAEAAARAQAADQAAATAERSVDDVAGTSFAAGRAKADADRAEADLPPRKKAAEDRLAAATKAAGEIEGQLKKAEIVFGASEFDVGLSRTNTDTAARGLVETQAARSAVESGLPALEAALTLARQRAQAATNRPFAALAFSPDRKALAGLAADGHLATWSAETGAELDTVDDPALAAADLAWMDADTLEFRHPNGVRRLSLAPRWTLERTLGSDPGSAPLTDRVNAVAFSPDGLRLATGSGEPSRSGEIRLWRVANGTLERDLGTPHSDAVLSLAFAPSAPLLLSGGADRFMRLLDLGTGRAVRQFEGHTHHVLGVAWRRDGRTVASAGADTVVKTWNRLTGDRLKNVEGFGKEVTAIAPVGITDQFIAVSGSGQVRIFKENGEQVRTLPAGSAFLQALAVTPDGRVAAAGGDDGVLRLWTVADGKVLAELPPPGPGAFSSVSAR